MTKFKTNWKKGDGKIFYTAPQVAELYRFPVVNSSGQPANGTGQIIGIIELGGGYTNEQIITYMKNLDPIKYKNYDASNITSVSVNGGVNTPPSSSNPPNQASTIYNDSIEVALDIETIVSIVPKATIRVYFAPNNDSDFQDAVQMAITDGCNIISISWAGSEYDWSSSDMQSFNSVCADGVTSGVAIYCSSGDSGAYNGKIYTNINFPSSSPNVTSCGGTSISSSGGSITSEIVWYTPADLTINEVGSGGGISIEFAKPSYQTNITYPQLANSTYRGIPDISGNADPNTGYKILVIQESSNQYEEMVVGGTSAVAPLWAAYTARINQINNISITLVQSTIDSETTSTNYLCSDILTDNNGYYNAETGWDCCSGWGSPATALVDYYASVAPTTSYCDLSTQETMNNSIILTGSYDSFWLAGNGQYIFNSNDILNSYFLFNNQRNIIPKVTPDLRTSK